MFLRITVNQLHGCPIISHMLICLFYSLYYDIISLISLKITQIFLLLLGFVENQIVFCDFKIWNSIRIMEIRIIKVLLWLLNQMLRALEILYVLVKAWLWVLYVTTTNQEQGWESTKRSWVHALLASRQHTECFILRSYSKS